MTTKQRGKDEQAKDAGADSASGGGSTEQDAQTGSAAANAEPNQNRVSSGRGEDLWAAEQQLRGGVTPTPKFPEAPDREEQEENAQRIGLEQAKNLTGTKDGVSSVLPSVGGSTNLALTPAEVFAQLDDEAVDANGRLTGIYLDDLERAKAQERREYVEQSGARDRRQSANAAARVRELASSPVTPAADRGKPADEQALVDPAKHTSSDDVDPNDPKRRTGERAENERAGASAQA